MSDEVCLFCKIVDGKIPGEFVYQDDRCVVLITDLLDERLHFELRARVESGGRLIQQ